MSCKCNFDNTGSTHEYDCPLNLNRCAVKVVKVDFIDQLEAEIKRLKERYKEYEQLWKIVDQGTCDGNCDLESPYMKCPACLAGSVINECGEIRSAALQDIEQAFKEK